MNRSLRRAASAMLVSVLLGATPHRPADVMASGRIVASKFPYLPGSAVPLSVDGIDPPYAFELVGPGSIGQSILHLPESPSASSATVIASGRGVLAMHQFGIASPPSGDRPFVAIASYDSGVVLHRATAPFAAFAVLGIGGAPSDVALDGDGRIAAGDTSGDMLAIAQMNPWNVSIIPGVAVADEIAFDDETHALFATDRDVSGFGALTRILPDGTVTRRTLGLTSEGIAVDSKRGRVYVANANDGTISIVDASTMREIRRFRAIDRAFSLALSPDGGRLFVVSNQSISSFFAAAGRVVAFDVTSERPRIVARSTPLAFPLGVALDPVHDTLFVTDERDDDVYVLDPHTLRPKGSPLRTCRTPWKPTVDSTDNRLYIPCAQADRVDVVDTRTLRRLRGAPFATGGYPLAIAVWHSERNVVR